MRKVVIIFLVVLFCIDTITIAQEPRVISLDEAVELALKNNTSFLAKELSSDAAKWGYAQAISGWLPKVYLRSSYTRMDEDTVERANIFYESMRDKAKLLGIDESRLRPSAYEDNYQTSIVVVQPITNGGAEWASIKAGLSSRRAQEAEKNLSALELKRSVKKSYFSVLQASAMLEVAREASKLANESLKLAKAKFELGQIAKAELLRWEVKKAEAESSLIEAQNAYTLAKASLAELIGLGIDEQFELERLPEEIPQEVLNSLLSEVKEFQFLESHPLIKQMAATVDLAKSERLISYSKALPSLNFTYTYSWEMDEDIELDGFESWTAIVSLEVPLFQSGYGLFGIKKSHKSVAAARSSYLEAKRMLTLQAFSAKRNLEAAIKKLETSQKRLEAASETLKLAQESYKVGLISQLELLDAQLVYQSARSDVVNAIVEFLSAKADWEYVAGK